MLSKHAPPPGPYQVVYPRLNRFEIRAKDGTDIALVKYHGNGRTAAIVTLLASAPELLVCCKIALEYFEANGPENYSWFEKFRAAIMKAEGK